MFKFIYKMKKFRVTLFCLCLVAISSQVSFSSTAGWDYKSEVTIDRIDGRTYIRTDCEDKLGDDCNMPGSSSRVDISIMINMLKAFSRIR